MNITINAQTIITAGAVVSTLVMLVKLLANAHKSHLEQLEQQRKQEVKQKQFEEEIQEVKREQCLLVYGVLACLKGLKEQGCNGPVSEAILKIEKHINQSAHDLEKN